MNTFHKVLAAGIGLILALVTILIIEIAEKEKYRKENEGKIIFIENNSMGCSKYSLNGDYFWKCPKDLDVSQIESKYCGGSGIHRNCRTEQEPVL